MGKKKPKPEKKECHKCSLFSACMERWHCLAPKFSFCKQTRKIYPVVPRISYVRMCKEQQRYVVQDYRKMEEVCYTTWSGDSVIETDGDEKAANSSLDMVEWNRRHTHNYVVNLLHTSKLSLKEYSSHLLTKRENRILHKADRLYGRGLPYKVIAQQESTKYENIKQIVSRGRRHTTKGLMGVWAERMRRKEGKTTPKPDVYKGEKCLHELNRPFKLDGVIKTRIILKSKLPYSIPSHLCRCCREKKRFQGVLCISCFTEYEKWKLGQFKPLNHLEALSDECISHYLSLNKL